jgi:predicted RNA binding protein YcfA (HicA-like mRNA interferase family)
MARLPIVSSEQVIKALRRAGFIDAPKLGKGSHRALYKVDETGRKRLVIVLSVVNCRGEHWQRS